MLNFDNFDWGVTPDKDAQYMLNECLNSIYEKIFPVEENDIVVDIGAFVGDFAYSILHKNPKHIWAIEPVEDHFRTLYKNLKGYPVSFVRGAFSEKDVEIEWCGSISKSPSINFKEFVTNNCIDKMDFLKTDCEGGEYLIFTEENLDYLKNNVRKIAGEFHLREVDKKDKFKYFRDNILTKFDNYYVYSVDGVDIKWDLFNDHFLQYYQEIHIFIDNRKNNNI